MCASISPTHGPKNTSYPPMSTVLLLVLFPMCRPSQPCRPSSINYSRHQRYDPLAHARYSSMPTIQYLSTNPIFPPFNFPCLFKTYRAFSVFFTFVFSTYALRLPGANNYENIGCRRKARKTTNEPTTFLFSTQPTGLN